VNIFIFPVFGTIFSRWNFTFCGLSSVLFFADGGHSSRFCHSFHSSHNDTWYEAVYALLIAWPDVTDIGAYYFKKTSTWQLLRHHHLNAQQVEELLILNRPNRPGDDVKDNVLPYSYKKEWWEGTG